MGPFALFVGWLFVGWACKLALGVVFNHILSHKNAEISKKVAIGPDNSPGGEGLLTFRCRTQGGIPQPQAKERKDRQHPPLFSRGGALKGGGVSPGRAPPGPEAT
jgi:hypothetical protein